MKKFCKSCREHDSLKEFELSHAVSSAQIKGQMLIDLPELLLCLWSPGWREVGGGG